MSLEVSQFQLASSPHYIMNNLHSTASPNTTSCPSSHAFILRPISPVSTVNDESLDDEGIPNGVHVDDPIDKIMIARLPEHIRNPHLPMARQVFPIFHTSPRQLLPLFPLPLNDIKNYDNPHIHNSIYLITFSVNAPPILLDQAGLDDPKSFFFYL